MSNKEDASQPPGSNDVRPSQQKPTISSLACQTLKTKPSPTAMRMCPPITLRNWKFHKPLLAIGTTSGVIQIFNLSSGKIFHELSVHNHPVKGIEWIGLNAFLSYAVSFQGNQSNWELHVTELDTGRTVQLKKGENVNSVIQSVKASHLRQYFVVIYKNDPFEIWDLNTLSLIKRVPKQFSGIVAAEWNPLYTKKVEATKDHQQQQQTEHQAGSGATTVAAPLKENFVVTNKMGELLHFSIAGTVVKEISRIPPETTMSKAVTAIAWKSDHVILGRSDGSISVWDLGKKESRTVSTMRGSIKRIRFAPGKDNMKILILFDDGADIWDVRPLVLMSTIIGSEHYHAKVEDSDWAASDRPVILISDGSIVVSDLDFNHDSSSESQRTVTNPDSKQSTSNNFNPDTRTPSISKQHNLVEPCNLQ